MTAIYYILTLLLGVFLGSLFNFQIIKPNISKEELDNLIDNAIDQWIREEKQHRQASESFDRHYSKTSAKLNTKKTTDNQRL